MLFLQQWHSLSVFGLDKQCIDRISFRKFFGFPEKYRKVPQFSHSEKDIGKCKKNKCETVTKPTYFLGLKMKKERFREPLLSIQIIGMKKRIKPSRKLSKNKGCIDGAWPKKKW